MKKRNGLIVAGLVVLAIGWVFTATGSQNELDFLRKYPHQEKVSPSDVGWARSAPFWSSANRFRSFTFPEVSPELFAELKKYSTSHPSLQRMELVFPSGRRAMFRHRLENSQLLFLDEPPPSWVAQQWGAVRERIGLLSRDERAEMGR